MSAVLDRNAELTALHADIERKCMFPFWATNAGPGHDEVKRLMGAAPRLGVFLGRKPCFAVQSSKVPSPLLRQIAST